MMPSPAQLAPSAQLSTRHARRKRHESEEGATLRLQPQRKKSKLNSDLFSPASNGHANADGTQLKANGHAPPGSGERASPNSSLDIPYRALVVQKGPQRKDDGSVTLTKNDSYSVKQLLHLPQQLREAKRADFRGACIGRSGYALAITRDQAVVWDYTSPSHSITTRAFPLNHPAKLNEPLPLGALVTAGTSTETGLVVVNAANGKISFWENIENADALSLFERRHNGAEGSCGGLLSGETVTDLESVGSAGFVLSFTSGRTAQLVVRDAQSRPAITVHFLRGRGSSNGFFGGLKHVFGGAYLKTIAAVRHRHLHLRELEEIIVVNEDALFQFWQLSWSGQPAMAKELDAQTVIEAAVSSTFPAETSLQSVKLVDFAIVSDDAETSDLLLLVNYYASGSSNFALIEVNIDLEGVSTRRTIKLRSYSDSLRLQSAWRPRLCLPSPRHTAVIFFEKAITIVSLSTTSPSPEAQLLMDSGHLPEPFQDTVYFRDDNEFTVCGANNENSTAHDQSSSVVAFVKGFGLLRITTNKPPSESETTVSVGASAKAKIEQAVFFGSIPLNPLNLKRKGDHPFSLDEIEEAALQISHEILATESPYVAPVAASMAEHIESRAKNLKDLASHVLSLSSHISRETRWKLRWDGEKMAAAGKVWALYDVLLQARWREMRMLAETLIIMHETDKTEMDRPSGQHDQVRLWFTKDVWRMQHLFEWVFKALDVLKEDDMVRDGDKYLELIGEAHDILIEGFEAAFTFREENARFYGLENEIVRYGVLQNRGGYEDLPEYWTATMRLLVQIREHFYRIRKPLINALKTPEDFDDVPDIVKKLVFDCPRLVDTFCRSFEEAVHWHWTRPGEEEQRDAEGYQIFYEAHRTDMIISLVSMELSLSDEATEIAEKYRDMPALVQIVSLQSVTVMNMLKSSNTPDDKMNAENLEREVASRIGRYFKMFGHQWGEAMYSKNILNGVLSTLLCTAKDHKKELTRFLRASPSRAKLSWINDIISERDYAKAADSLTMVAKEQEDKLWSRKVELSISKLALLAASDGEKGNEQSIGALVNTEDESQLVDIQEQVYEHVRPFLYDAVDQSAELQLAMETFGAEATKSTPALTSLLERGLAGVIEHNTVSIEELIDVLTLMDRRPCPMREHDISTRQTYLALSTLKCAGLGNDRKRFELLLRLIWKRCFMSDDWKRINDTSKKDDEGALADLESTVLFKTIREGHVDGLWDGSSGVRLILASDCIGAGTIAEDYLYRFHNAEIRSRIAQDVSRQDVTLQQYMDKYQLESWILTTKEAADRRLREKDESQKGMTSKVGSMVKTIQEERDDPKTRGDAAGISC